MSCGRAGSIPDIPTHWAHKDLEQFALSPFFIEGAQSKQQICDRRLYGKCQNTTRSIFYHGGNHPALNTGLVT